MIYSLPTYAIGEKVTTTTINMNVAIILGIVFLGLLTSLGKNLLQLAGSKVVLYIELISALMVLGIMVTYFLNIYLDLRSASKTVTGMILWHIFSL